MTVRRRPGAGASGARPAYIPKSERDRLRDEEIAAIYIQKVFRGYLVRKRTFELENMIDGASPMLKLRFRIWHLMEDSESSRAAQIMSIFILATIIFSIACMMLRTMEELDAVVKVEHWTYIEYTTTAIFTLEYFARLAVCNVYGTSIIRWILDPMNLCDFFAVAPFYVELSLKFIYGTDSGLGFLRALRSIRLIRLFRVFKLGKYSKGMKVMQEAIALSSQALTLLIFMLGIAVILFGAIVFFAEQVSCPEQGGSLLSSELYTEVCRNGGYQGTGFHFDTTSKKWELCCDEYGHPADFSSIVDSAWWAIVTMTTVGYGDKYPRTLLGKLVGAICMLFGILLIALPTAIVGQKFQEVYRKQHDLARFQAKVEKGRSNMLVKRFHKFAAKAQAAGMTGENMSSQFRSAASSSPSSKAKPKASPGGPPRICVAISANFGKMLLVFGCIGSDFCKKICVLQHFSKYTRFST
jgi:voltage-gated potassium channel Kch